MKLLEKTPRSKDDFISRVEMLFETTLDAYIEERGGLIVVMRQQPNHKIFRDYVTIFVNFMERCKEKDLVRKEIDSEMVTGYMLDRIHNQVQFAPWIKEVSGTDIIGDFEYRQRWCRANIDLIFYGVLPR
jgi:hypothetical protein